MPKFSPTVRLHIRLGARRTTVSLDKILAEYLALHLGEEPGSQAAHTAIRAWAQGEIDGAGDPGRIHVSQWLLGRALLVLARPELADAWKAWG